jgi:hypothetical protein
MGSMPQVPTKTLKSSILKNQTIKFLVSFYLFLVIIQVKGQSNINSPYSSIGIGERVLPGYAENQAMGGAGVASSLGLYVNTLNPALLARNKYTSFAVGLSVDQKTATNGTIKENNLSGNLNYLNLSFPVKPKWSMGIALNPYSTSRFSINNDNLTIPGDTSRYFNSLDTKGGITQIAFSNAVDLGKEFMLGLETSLLFGTSTKSSNSTLKYISNGSVLDDRYRISLIDNRYTSGLYYRLGAAWHHKLKKDKYFNVGLSVEPKNTIGQSSLKTIQSFSSNNSAVSAIDTLSASNKKEKITLPSTFRFGLSYEHSFKYTIFADLYLAQNSTFKNTSGSNEGLINQTKVHLGYELFPNFTSVKFFKRTAYRAGFSTGTSAYSHWTTGKQLRETSFTVGLGLPLRNSSLLNVSYQAGVRGTTNNAGLRETYQKVTLGFALNDLWFIKQKID